ncbi:MULTISPECIES: hypothetical protein [unclassified Moorena]|uniref:hypothetical protein n=1 Tax=unclassified Moorena TaxID=2683338 RepID=UPI001400124E|nr:MULTISPECIES: hypothetical protein [unclassified Moorena]NEQ00857.1 hypothetical protein [Moorena sp. SIO3F7]
MGSVAGVGGVGGVVRWGVRLATSSLRQCCVGIPYSLFPLTQDEVPPIDKCWLYAIMSLVMFEFSATTMPLPSYLSHVVLVMASYHHRSYHHHCYLNYSQWPHPIPDQDVHL